MLPVFCTIFCMFYIMFSTNFIVTTSTSNRHEERHFNTIHSSPTVGKYVPTWSSLDARPLPPWYDKAKIGVKVSWGLASVPSFRNEWFWYSWMGPTPDPKSIKFMKQNYPPGFTYQEFAPMFTAEFFDPYHLADILQSSGAKYVVFTSKHHDGYTLWPSKYSFGWNSMDAGPNRDLIDEMATAIRNKTYLKFGLYHSWYEWFNPLYLKDKSNGFNTSLFVRQKAFPELKELVEKYQPEVIWSDGDWEAPDEYWRSKEFLAWLYNSSPVKDTVVVNDRWGIGTTCKHGGVFNCEDRYNPGQLFPHKWENALSMDKSSWYFRRNADVNDYLSIQEVIGQLVSTVSCGGNFLINVGPTKDGTIAAIMQERLMQLGQWLGVNGPAIYESQPWPQAQNDSVTNGVWYTCRPKESKVFSVILEKAWPEVDNDGKSKIVLGSVDSKILRIKSITMLGIKQGRHLNWKPCSSSGSEDCDKGIQVNLPYIRPIDGQWGWTLVIDHY